MRIIDIRSEVDDGKEHPRTLIDVRLITIHRIFFNDWDPNQDVGGLEIALRFIHDPKITKYTGGENPYTFYDEYDGTIAQALDLTDRGNHARRWNHSSVGVAVIGDMRKRPPTRAQYASLVELCADLSCALDIDPLGETELGQDVVPSLAGHSELPGGSADPDKQCPGQWLPMDKLRLDVSNKIQAGGLQRLSAAGGVV